jgi:Flp pilus assembly protein TadD
VWLLRGTSAIFTPAMWGGGLDKAQTILEGAVARFETERPADGAPSWGRWEAYAWLGQVYQRRGHIAEARAMYEKALEAQPNARWVATTLLPSVQVVSSK